MSTPTENTVAAFRVNITNDPYLNSLLNGAKWGSSSSGVGVSLTYSFPDSSSSWQSPVYTDLNEPRSPEFRGLSEAEKLNVRSALQTWAKYANITFIEVSETSSNVGDIRFAYTSYFDGSGVMSGYSPSSGPAGGDVWIKSGIDWKNFAVGSVGFLDVLHEIGHALGLKHPFSTSSFNTVLLDSSLDFFYNTIMGYNIFPGKSLSNGQYSVSYLPTTPMAIDISAIQYIYGVNSNYNNNNNIYSYSEGQNYFETIYDTGGTDTIVWDSATQGGSIDLRPSLGSKLGNPITVRDSSGTIVQSDARTVFIWQNSIIENATGSGGNDTLVGNMVDNQLIGGGRNDFLDGGAGHDNLYGGSGIDTMFGGDGNDHLYGQSASGGPDDRDFISAGAGNDYLQGNAGDDELGGGDGSDRIQGGQGDDLIFGESGNDTINGNLGNDTIDGGADNDSIRGGQGNDSISGGDGNDIVSGDLGQDTLRGGAGSDISQFSGLGSTSTAPDQITDFQDGSDRIALGFIPLAVLTGSAQSSLSAAASAAQSLLDGNAGSREVAAIAIGSDTYLFYASDGGATVNSAIQITGLGAGIFSVADFV